ncbi:hypothetical protein Hanom_Chr09g00819231 [Helianthus anomalus]
MPPAFSSRKQAVYENGCFEILVIRRQIYSLKNEKPTHTRKHEVSFFLPFVLKPMFYVKLYVQSG